MYDLGFSDGVSDFHAENPWDPVSDGPDPSVSHYYDGYGAGWEEAAYEQSGSESVATGRVYVEPIVTEVPEDAVYAMVAELGVPLGDLQDCNIAWPSDPCISVPRDTHWAGVDHTAYAEVRLTLKDQRSEYDFALLITAYEAAVDGWVVDREWTTRSRAASHNLSPWAPPFSCLTNAEEYRRHEIQGTVVGYSGLRESPVAHELPEQCLAGGTANEYARRYREEERPLHR